MRTVLAAFLAASVLITSLASVQAQAPGDAGTTTWYVHNFKTPDGVGSVLNFEPYADEADQTATCTACAGPAPHKIKSAAEEALAAEFTGPGKAGKAFLSMKSWNNAPAPQTKVVVNVLADATLVATGTLTKEVMLGAIVKYEIPLSVKVESLPAGAVMSMEVLVSESACGCYNPAAYPRGVSKDNPWGFTLPFAASASSAAPSIQLAAEGASANVGETGIIPIQVLNNGTEPASVVLAAAGELELVFDNATVEAIANGTTNATAKYDLRDAEPGKSYNVTINATVAGIEVANVTITIQALAAPGSTGPADAPSTSSPEASSKEEEPTETPGFGLVALAASGLAVVAWRRRKA